MFLLDDLIMSPVRGFMMIAKEIRKAALAEREEYSRELTQRLSTLYAQLDRGELTEEEFDTQETIILDLLDGLEQLPDADDSDSQEEEHDEDQDEDQDEENDEELDEDEPGDSADTEPSLSVKLLELPGDPPGAPLGWSTR